VHYLYTEAIYAQSLSQFTTNQSKKTVLLASTSEYASSLMHTTVTAV